MQYHSVGTEFLTEMVQKHWRKTIEKVGRTKFYNINFFIFPTTSSCVAKVSCTRTQNSEKLAQMRSNVEHRLLVQSVTRFFLDRRREAEKVKFRFAPKLPRICITRHVHWELSLAHSLVIEPKQGSEGWAPSAWRFLRFTIKIIHFYACFSWNST